MRHYLFVYGSLMRNPRTKAPCFLLDKHKAVFLGEGFVAGVDLYRVGERAIIAANGVGGSYGEIYAVTEDCLNTLDKFEDVRRGAFQRVTLEASCGDIGTVPVEIYKWVRPVPSNACVLREGRYVPAS